MKKKRSIKKKNLTRLISSNKKNIIFVVAIIIVLIIIICLSLNNSSGNGIPRSTGSDVYSFDTSDFSNIVGIGVNEYLASLNSSDTSVIFFCSNEEEECYNELTALNDIKESYDVSVDIEYIDVLELVDSEIEELKNSSDIFTSPYYPNLVIIEEGEIKDVVSYYSDSDGIVEFLSYYDLIS